MLVRIIYHIYKNMCMQLNMCCVSSVVECGLYLLCDACSLRCSWSGIIFVLLYRCCVLMSYVHPVAVLNAGVQIVYHG